MKILPVGTELFHADRRTDMTMLTVAFRNSANAPKYDNLFTENKITRQYPVKRTGQTEQKDLAVSIYNSHVRISAKTPAIQNVTKVI